MPSWAALAGNTPARRIGSQVTEMLLDIIAWTQQKPLVALALDIPPDPSALTSLDFDEHGEPIIGATLG